MLLSLLLTSLLPSQKIDPTIEFEDFRRTDIVVLARYVGSLEPTSQRCEALDQTLWIQKMRFQPLIPIKGDRLTAEFIASTPSDRKQDQLGFKQNQVFLVGVYRQDSAGTLPTHGISDWRYKAETPDQYHLANQYPLPDIGYAATGTTLFEKCSSLFTQAFVASKNPEYLDRIMGFARGLTAFYSAQVEPALLSAAAGDDVLKAQVLWTSQAVGKMDGRDELKSLISKIDAQTENVDAELPPLPAAFSDQLDYLRTMLHARTTAFRVAAINAFEAKPERRDLIISMLGDSKKRVRYYAIKWLYKLHEEGAPQPKWGANETVENEAEVIAYWRGR